ncbi:MAG: ATP-binding protein [Acidobacteria bacterium]|nr:ATP-binding protein [Acidobacteriota bacterium]
MDRRKLPIGIQTFRQIREEDYYYVDKTAYACRIGEDAGKHLFLSRPRRFGKSLFVDTVKELYEGNEPLFRGLAVHDAWDWSKRHPVVRLSFAGGNFKRPGELHASVMRQLAACERRAGLPASDVPTPAGRFADLLEALHDRTGERGVVLVDEYDKPILDALEGPAPAGERGEMPAAANAQAIANRDDLRGLYGTIKDCDAHVELTFITGVSRFSKVSLFSGLNNLTDLTLNPHYSAICGYTDADLDTVFAPELPGLERDEIRAWYNGYAWRGSENVYNPYAILHLFASREFEAHWFETATPRFLIDTLLRHGFAAPDLENVHADAALLSTFDVDAMPAEALLFQTGYLTIVDEERRDGRTLYRLAYPNRKVRRGLNDSLLDALAPSWRSAGDAGALRRLLSVQDWTGVESLFRRLLAGIPHDWHRRNDIARYEGYWSSVFYAWFRASLDHLAVEDATSRSRLDMALRLEEDVYLFEFKVAGRSEQGAALAQLKARRYADKYRAPGRTVHLIGVEVSAETRDITAFDVEPA